MTVTETGRTDSESYAGDSRRPIVLSSGCTPEFDFRYVCLMRGTNKGSSPKL